MQTYDCTEDVLDHKLLVASYMLMEINGLVARVAEHDNSKLLSPEKEMFDQWTPELKARTFGTDFYKAALDGMGEGLKHHYRVNRHHPEHFENGVDGMNLLDVLEMVCDWRAAAQAKGVALDLEHAAQRFNLSPQLVNIIRNSI